LNGQQYFGKNGNSFEIEANFSVCTVKWVEVEKGRGGGGGGRNGGGG
jgi:hypothetical protein